MEPRKIAEHYGITHPFQSRTGTRGLGAIRKVPDVPNLIDVSIPDGNQEPCSPIIVFKNKLPIDGFNPGREPGAL